MRIFISGGCKNGKSTYAQKLALRNRKMGAPLYYVATMEPSDEEDRLRVRRHQDERRGMNFITVEQARQIEKILSRCEPNGSFLLDSLTALLANEMFTDSENYSAAAVRRGLAEILCAINDIVIVSDFIYADVALFDTRTEVYRRTLADLDRMCAAHCDVVLEAVSGSFVSYKGALNWS
jgi:adenosylcobinamide kinase/adenosylcobinamide-phosphate guanylyltransferase